MTDVLIVIAVILVCIILIIPAIYTACATGQIQCLIQIAPILI